jgi:hypothetical protein
MYRVEGADGVTCAVNACNVTVSFHLPLRDQSDREEEKKETLSDATTVKAFSHTSYVCAALSSPLDFEHTLFCQGKASLRMTKQYD